MSEPTEFFAESVSQFCSPGCRYFTPLPADASGDFGRCTNPRSPFHGYPVSLEHECRFFEPATATQPLPAN